MSCFGFRPFYDLLQLFIGTLICGFIAFVKFVVESIRKGPTHIFRRQNRHVMPEILANSDFGSHEFYRLPVCILSIMYVCVCVSCVRGGGV